MTTQFNYDRFNQLKESVQFKEGQENLYMSNQYFDIILDLKNNKTIKPAHVGFVYSYMYLQTYLFRYSTYDHFVPKTSQIKEMLGYNADEKRVNYIIKDKGILDVVGLTHTLYDFPVTHSIEDGVLNFNMLSDFKEVGLREMKGIKSTQSCKYPTLAFYSEIKGDEIPSTDSYEGSFFDVSNTTNIPFDVFAYCMSHEGLGTTGFYIYSYIKHMNDIYSDYKATAKTIASKLGMSKNTVVKYMNVMRGYNLIQSISNMEYFTLGWNDNEREPNSIVAFEYSDFSANYEEYTKTEIKTRYEHYKIIKEKQKQLEEEKIEFKLEDLPF